MTDPYEAILAVLREERLRLDAQLDEALQQFALFEDDIAARMAGASPDQLAALMDERAQLEEALGITDLVERIDALRERTGLLEHQLAPTRAAG